MERESKQKWGTLLLPKERFLQRFRPLGGTAEPHPENLRLTENFPEFFITGGEKPYFPNRRPNPFFGIGFFDHGTDLTAGVSSGLSQFVLGDLVFNGENGFAFGMGRTDFSDRKCAADGVVPMCFAHSAHHSVNFNRIFPHNRNLFLI